MDKMQDLHDLLLLNLLTQRAREIQDREGCTPQGLPRRAWDQALAEALASVTADLAWLREKLGPTNGG